MSYRIVCLFVRYICLLFFLLLPFSVKAEYYFIPGGMNSQNACMRQTTDWHSSAIQLGNRYTHRHIPYYNQDNPNLDLITGDDDPYIDPEMNIDR